MLVYRYLFTCFCFLIVCIAEGQKVAADAKEGELIVKGRIANVNPPAQLWIYMGDEKWDTIAVKDGRFEYRKKTMLPAYGAMMLRYKPYVAGEKNSGSFFSNMSLMSFFFEKGTMTVHTTVDTLKAKHVTVKGSVIHGKHIAYWNKEGKIIGEQKKIAAVFDKATPEQLKASEFQAAYEQKNEQLLKQWDALIEAEVRKYPASLHAFIDFLGYKRLREPDDATALTIAKYFSPAYREKAVATIESTAREKKRREIKIESGDEFPVFEMKDPSGAMVDLKNYRGKYILVDFWASWCVPCRKVNPDLVKIYEKFKGRSFNIIGVSLDTDTKAWKEAIHADQLGWLHASDLKGMDGIAADKYGILFIPQSYLLDPAGKVIAKNLKPAELEAELEKLLK